MKKIIISAIVIIIILIIAIIVINQNNSTSKDINSINSELEQQNRTEENTNNDVFYANEGGTAYNDSMLDNFEFEIVNLSDRAKNEIGDVDDFTLQMKRYLYQNGLILGNEAQLKEYTLINNEVQLRFELNDDNRTNVTATISEQNDEVEFSKE